MASTNLREIRHSELVQETFSFWFTDQQHIRSPFPLYIREDLRKKATKKFRNWISRLDEKARKELNDASVREKLEEYIFETAIKLVKTEDEKLTIFYPFMPRINDRVNPGENTPIAVQGTSIVKHREVVKDGDKVYMKVQLETIHSLHSWETNFELPG